MATFRSGCWGENLLMGENREGRFTYRRFDQLLSDQSPTMSLNNNQNKENAVTVKKYETYNEQNPMMMNKNNNTGNGAENMYCTTTNNNNKLRPEAPAFVPIENLLTSILLNQQPRVKEPQCSRYSRKSVRREDANDENVSPLSSTSSPLSPRPILGNKNSVPRAILGRKEYLVSMAGGNANNNSKHDEGGNNGGGREVRSLSRRMHRMKVAEENKKQGANYGANNNSSNNKKKNNSNSNSNK